MALARHRPRHDLSLIDGVANAFKAQMPVTIGKAAQSPAAKMAGSPVRQLARRGPVVDMQPGGLGQLLIGAHPDADDGDIHVDP